jgi:hypothetical protein
MRRGSDLGVLLLGVLKAGGSYAWMDPERASVDFPVGVSFSLGGRGSEEKCVHLDLASVLGQCPTYSPNLPIIARGTDAACVLEDEGGTPIVVPHATITALRARALPRPTPWVGEAGAFDLWMALMAGTTAVVESAQAVVAAA